jgi:hypothetical protein
MPYRVVDAFRIALIAGLIGCGDSSGPTNRQVCADPVTLTVSSGATPVISWAPDCLANQLVITEQGGIPVWILFLVADNNMLRSPVRFGVPRDGALGIPSSPAALTVGTTYTVDLIADPAGQPVDVVGTTDVTP